MISNLKETGDYACLVVKSSDAQPRCVQADVGYLVIWSWLQTKFSGELNSPHLPLLFTDLHEILLLWDRRTKEMTRGREESVEIGNLGWMQATGKLCALKEALLIKSYTGKLGARANKQQTNKL